MVLDGHMRLYEARTRHSRLFESLNQGFEGGTKAALVYRCCQVENGGLRPK